MKAHAGWNKFLELTTWQPLIHVTPVFRIEHKGRFSQDVARWNGEVLMFSCEVHRNYNEAMKFAERETGKSDWIVRDGYPIENKEGRWVWVLIR